MYFNKCISIIQICFAWLSHGIVAVMGVKLLIFVSCELYSANSGIIWLILNPDSFYSIAEDPSIDIDSLEVSSAMVVIGLGVFVYLSTIF